MSKRESGCTVRERERRQNGLNEVGEKVEKTLSGRGQSWSKREREQSWFEPLNTLESIRFGWKLQDRGNEKRREQMGQCSCYIKRS